MTYRMPALLLIALGLSGCSTPVVQPLSLTGMELPRLDVFNYAIPDRSVRSEAYALTTIETETIKSSISAAYHDGRTLHFGPISARRTVDRSIVVCGLVDVPSVEGAYSGMRLFDGEGIPREDGSLAFEPRRIAGRNAPSMDVFIHCRDSGVI